MNYELKGFINELYELADSLDEGPFGLAQNTDSDTTLKKCIQVELCSYLMYLSAADGKIAWQEASFIRDYLDYDLTVDDIHQIIIDNEIYSTEFEEKVPLSMKVLVNVDNALYKANGYNDQLGSELLLTLFEGLGKEFLACDADVSENEIRDLSIYLTMLRNYIDCEVNSKNDNSVNIESKNYIEKNSKDNDQQNNEIMENDESLEELLEELNSLTGLDDVKKDVNSLINLLQIRKIREERGMKQMPMSLHLVFSGNLGTGKTTVARLLAKIYCKLGVLTQGHLVEVDRSGLVGGYVGQTAIKVQDVIQKSLGSILFIDEAYSLTANKGENDYGLEAVDTLLKGMEDHRDNLVVIVAGYPDLMNEFLNSNPGLRSRFNKFINFADYKPEELVDIFENMCSKSGYKASDECIRFVQKYFEKRYMTRNVNFANGRDVRNFFEMAMVNQANRLSFDMDISNEELEEFTLADVENIAV